MAGRRAAGALRVVALALLGVAARAPAQAEVQACSAASAGQLSVQAEVQCECRFFVESRLKGTPAGYRWDCGILRPRLSVAVPVDLNPYPYALPEALSLELPFGRDARPAQPERR